MCAELTCQERFIRNKKMFLEIVVRRSWLFIALDGSVEMYNNCGRKRIRS